MSLVRPTAAQKNNGTASSNKTANTGKTSQSTKQKASADTAAAAAARANRWDLGNWNAGKVSVFQALGIKKGKLDWPQLQPSFTMGATQEKKISQNTQTKKDSKTKTTSTDGGGGPISSSGNPTGGNTTSNQALGQQLASQYGWSYGNQWTALNNVVMAESGWQNTAQNPNSTAYGIGQFLDTTWATVGGTKTSDPATQIQYMLKYIKQRYGTPEGAWAHEQAYSWY